jgi:hypothetical protein
LIARGRSVLVISGAATTVRSRVRVTLTGVIEESVAAISSVKLAAAEGEPVSSPVALSASHAGGVKPVAQLKVTGCLPPVVASCAL